MCKWCISYEQMKNVIYRVLMSFSKRYDFPSLKTISYNYDAWNQTGYQSSNRIISFTSVEEIFPIAELFMWVISDQ